MGIPRGKHRFTPTQKRTLKRVWLHCTHNREELARSKRCGCFYCKRLFEPSEITAWTDSIYRTQKMTARNPGRTAKCPYCDIDSVLGESEEYKLTRTLLRDMNRFFFTPIEV